MLYSPFVESDTDQSLFNLPHGTAVFLQRRAGVTIFTDNPDTEPNLVGSNLQQRIALHHQLRALRIVRFVNSPAGQRNRYHQQNKQFFHLYLLSA
nr:hypothetical protein [Geothermobacter hydrogeniphilus]